ncbi:four-domain proteases inhibitor-like [Mytilus californianus]|uniref:four-domain proteases inhibitor-like n=1 Tax=Mytilus californianus TaxID=6549 RepID=UPI002246C352|nr:four-domain proteases inhibitor-like [Mytilus californianus]
MLWFLMITYYITDFTSSQSDLCSKVLTIDCDGQYVSSKDESVCASDFVTYKTCCHFAQAKCRDGQIVIIYDGPCSKTTDMSNVTFARTCGTFRPPVEITTTSTATSSIKTTSTLDNDPFDQLFCSGINSGAITCPDTLDPYCGTDGKFYLNKCYFQTARCTNPSLSIQPIGLCKGPTPTPVG